MSKFVIPARYATEREKGSDLYTESGGSNNPLTQCKCAHPFKCNAFRDDVPKMIVSAVLPPRSRVIALIGVCPFCGKVHTHGGGTNLAKVREYLGPRASHCSNGSRGQYELVFAEDVP